LLPPPTTSYPLSLHDALPISCPRSVDPHPRPARAGAGGCDRARTAAGPGVAGARAGGTGRGRLALLAAAARAGAPDLAPAATGRSEEHTSELQSRENLVCRLL